MEETIQKLLAPGKGILAADAREKSMGKRLEALGLTPTPELALKFREILFTAAGIENFLSGVILNEDTVKMAMDGVPPQKILNDKGIIPGVKVDGGTEPFNNTEEEITTGLEGLDARLKEYSGMGLKFTKWRGVFSISDIFPSDAFIDENLDRMTGFAKVSHEYGFVPIVEPEILLTGMHTTTRCEEIETKVLKVLFDKLNEAEIDLKKIILKTSMILPGKDSGVQAAPFEVAQATLRTLKNSVPPEVPGIVFLSGGQTPDEATNNLNEINKLKNDSPWQLSFSFERALQNEALEEWEGKDENITKAQAAFLKRGELVGKARKGELK